MGKTPIKKKTQKQMIDEAVQAAADETFSILEDEDTFEDDGSIVGFEPQTASLDVFEEGFKKAMAMKDAVRYHIKKNSQFLTVKDYPYSWERLQAEFGPGWYQVQAKARSNGRILKSQTEMVGDPNEGKPQIETETQETKTDNNLAVLGWLQQSQERAEERARELAKQSEGSLATVMQSVMTAQQESTKTMMAMMMEQSKQTQTLLLAMMQNAQSNKGNDPMMTLLTTLLSRKPDDGFTAASVMKMIQDAESRAEQRATKNYELIEKKANELAEIKAEAMGSDDEKEESLTKTLLKGFVPVLSQMVANQGASNQLQAQLQEQQLKNPALREGFVEDPNQALRPAIRGPNRVQPQQAQSPVQPPKATQAVQPPPQKPAVQVNEPKKVTQPQALDDRQKDMVFNFVAGDIASAMIEGVPASKASEVILKKLEIEGITRHTVAASFSLADFYGYAEKFIPQEQLDAAKAWLKEFHESIQKQSGEKPIRTPRTVVVKPSGEGQANGNGNGVDPIPVAASGGTASKGRARTQSRTTAPSL